MKLRSTPARNAADASAQKHMSSASGDDGAATSTAPPRKYMKVSIFLSITLFTIMLSQALAYACTPFSDQLPGSTTHILNIIAAVAIGVQWVVFLHAGGVLFGNERTERFYDFTGACTFCFTSYLSISDDYEHKSWRQKFLTLCVLLWCIRLGGFLFWRINKDGGVDSRFASRKPDLLRFMIMWTIQGFWVFATALPVFTLNAGPDCTGPPRDEVTSRDIIGGTLWVFGMLFEIVADYQKTAWKMSKLNHGRYINTGLWSLSRHPNYFGEIIIWIGVFVMASGGFCSPGQWVSLFSPVFVSLLLIFISGIPLLEIAADKKWGKEPAYLKYKQNVPVLIPFIGRAGNAAF